MKRIGIVGCGNIARVHAWSLSQIDDLRIVAFADIRKERAERLSHEYTGRKAAVFDSLTSMLREASPDVVHICTPHELHVPMALEVLKDNRSVFMEKPPAITASEWEQLCVMGKAGPAEIGFCFQNRYNETTRALDEIVADKSLGNVIGGRAFVTWRRDEAYYSDDWHGSLKREGGGVLMNQAIHTLDLLLRHLGSPTKVAATINNHHLPGIIEVEDTLEAWMEFPEGKRACFYASNGYVTDAPVIIELAFDKGLVTMSGQTITILEQGQEPRQLVLSSEPGKGKSYWGSGHLTCIRDFYEHLGTGIPYQNNIEGVRNTMETTLRIYQNAREQNNTIRKGSNTWNR